MCYFSQNKNDPKAAWRNFNKTKLREVPYFGKEPQIKLSTINMIQLTLLEVKILLILIKLFESQIIVRG